MGGARRQEQLALGETPNIAARIQGLAAPNTVAISEVTSRLVQGYFDCEALVAQVLRGVAEPLNVSRVLRASGAQSRLDIASARGLTPLVGREHEVALLLERWEQAKSGQGQVVLLTGDAGIGKSRLVHMLKEHVANEPHTCWECRSVAYYRNTALFPLTNLFQRLLRFQAHETPDAKVEKLASALSQYRLPLEETVPLFAPLLALPLPENRYPLLNLSPQRQRQKTLETLVAILLELAERHPVLFIVEDLHWIDPSTLELLHLVIDQSPTTSLVTLLTCRPIFQPSWGPRSSLTEIMVNRLSPPQVDQIISHMTDEKTLPQEVLQQIRAKTDGVPLFVEEMTKAILESGHLQEVEAHYDLTRSLSTFAIPATLHDSLRARLDRLVTAKAVAQYAAVIGRQFAYDLLSTVSQLDETTLQRALGKLVEAGIVYQQDLPPQATYVFKHALIQETAYESLLKSTRQHYHQRIAQVLEGQFTETAEVQPELLAHHYTEGGLTEQAVHYWYHAGQSAVQRSAHVEAISHLTKGLEVLKTLPDAPERTQQELTLQIALGVPLQASMGWAAPEVEKAFTRARELCRQLGETPDLFPVLKGLRVFYHLRADFQAARELGEQCLRLAQRQRDPALLLEAHRALAPTLYCLGELAPARMHLEQAMALYDPQQHRSHAFLYGENPRVSCCSYAAWVLWGLGYPDQALQRSHEALALAHELAHPHSLAYALFYDAVLYGFRRENQGAQARAETLMGLSTDQEFALWVARGMILRGWVLTVEGQGEEGMAQMRAGLAAYQATGATLLQPYWLALLAEMYGKVAQAEEGLTALAEALALVHKTGERWWEAELHRLQGELLLMPALPDEQQAAACFRQALAVARHQQAKSLELRAATSLARLWQGQGKRAAARELLAPTYGWFTEGFDTADLQEAKALLAALALELGG
jgi:predicted ATPase